MTLTRWISDSLDRAKATEDVLSASPASGHRR